MGFNLIEYTEILIRIHFKYIVANKLAYANRHASPTYLLVLAHLQEKSLLTGKDKLKCLFIKLKRHFNLFRMIIKEKKFLI